MPLKSLLCGIFEQRALQALRPFKLGAFSLFFQGYEDPSNNLVSAIYESIEKWKQNKIEIFNL